MELAELGAAAAREAEKLEKTSRNKIKAQLPPMERIDEMVKGRLHL